MYFSGKDNLGTLGRSLPFLFPMQRIVIFIALMIAVIMVSLPVQASTTAKVTSIIDGDTIDVQQGNRKIRVRLTCVDAPEIAQSPWGTQSATQLRRLLPIGQQVHIREVGKDRDQRTIEEVFVGNRSINLALVEEGAAVVYHEYLKNCTATQQQYLMAEQFARSQKLGFWNQDSPTMLWDFRQSKAGQRSTGRRSQPERNDFPTCVRSDCNCSDFASRSRTRVAELSQVDTVFKAFPGDPFGLNQDGDGIPCESIRN